MDEVGSQRQETAFNDLPPTADFATIRKRFLEMPEERRTPPTMQKLVRDEKNLTDALILTLFEVLHPHMGTSTRDPKRGAGTRRSAFIRFYCQSQQNVDQFFMLIQSPPSAPPQEPVSAEVENWLRRGLNAIKKTLGRS